MAEQYPGLSLNQLEYMWKQAADKVMQMQMDNPKIYGKFRTSDGSINILIMDEFKDIVKNASSENSQPEVKPVGNLETELDALDEILNNPDNQVDNIIDNAEEGLEASPDWDSILDNDITVESDPLEDLINSELNKKPSEETPEG
jgi:hypothetical protein